MSTVSSLLLTSGGRAWKDGQETKDHFAVTVRHRGMGTGISEASKRVPIFSFATQGGKQVSSHFGQELSQGQELRQVGLNRLRFGSLLHGLSLK